MNQAPAISVILPVYNAHRYVREAIQSVLDQTFRDFELIVINDGSTDASLGIIHSLASKDARIRLISRANTGYVKALNEAIGLVTGEFIARMDADDFSLPTRFEKQIAYLRQNPDCVLLGTHVSQMDQVGAIIGPMRDVGFGHDQITKALLSRGWPIVHPSVMMRTWAVRAVGGYLPEHCPNEDHDLFLKLGEIGQLENLPEVLVRYRKHAASESTLKQHKTDGIISTLIVNACRRRGIPVPLEACQVKPMQSEKFDMERDWAWRAIAYNNIQTARKYAISTLFRRPFSLNSWRLTYCALRGY